MNQSALAIAATTATLQGILAEGLGGLNVTVRPLDTARNNTTGDQLNLFLYQVLPDAAWRNMDMPRKVRPNETAQPPLPLVLFYLITAFGTDNDSDIGSHALLGRAMSVLHDYPVIGADKIRTTIDGATANLEEQPERIRITLQPLTFEEISKLWTTFQTHYRTSAAYQVSVVLIESTRAPKTPAPVLKQGKDDQGPDVVAGPLPLIDEILVPLSGSFLNLDEVRTARTLPSAQLNDEIALIGREFTGGVTRVRFEHPLVATPFTLQPTALRDDMLIVKLPAAAVAAATWPAGIYKVSVVVSRPGEPDRSSKDPAVLALAPSITIAPLTSPPGNITLTITTAPRIRPGQRVTLLLADRPIELSAITGITNTLTFNLQNIAQADYLVRLRVDGIDSIPVNRTSQVPEFDNNQTLKVS